MAAAVRSSTSAFRRIVTGHVHAGAASCWLRACSSDATARPTPGKAPSFVVLGGSISGLTTAYLLQRNLPHAQIHIIEPRSACGGLVHTVHTDSGSVLEQGSYSSILVNKNGRETLGLVRLLGMDEEVMSANIEASARRHLFHRGRVQLVPGVSHMLQYGPALLMEPVWPRNRAAEDESVHAFVSRRSSTAVANRLADPICHGLFAADAHELSVRMCFPRLWFNEQRFRSVFIGAMLSTIPAYRRRSWMCLDLSDPLLQRVSTGGRCYSFRQGLGALVKRLVEALQAPGLGTVPAIVRTNTSVRLTSSAPESSHPGVKVHLSDGTMIDADTVISALPPCELSEVLSTSDLGKLNPDMMRSFCVGLQKVGGKSSTVVGVNYKEDVLKANGWHGAGYFCGSLEEQAILGMSWQSQLYPKQGQMRTDSLGGSRIAIYSEGLSEDCAREASLAALRDHLKIEMQPSEVCVRAQDVPIYTVGHRESMLDVNAKRLRGMPWLQLVGPGYFGARSPADEVVDARELADALSRRYARYPDLVENEMEEDVRGRLCDGFDLS